MFKKRLKINFKTFFIMQIMKHYYIILYKCPFFALLIWPMAYERMSGVSVLYVGRGFLIHFLFIFYSSQFNSLIFFIIVGNSTELYAFRKNHTSTFHLLSTTVYVVCILVICYIYRYYYSIYWKNCKIKIKNNNRAKLFTLLNVLIDFFYRNYWSFKKIT